MTIPPKDFDRLKTPSSISETAIKTLRLEAEAISKLADNIGEGFDDVVRLILQSKGRVVITGIGKSANIANKTVATLNSTGTPALFMHAADAIHGDLGNVQDDDIVICISKSGNSPEIKALVPLVKNLGNPLVAMVGNIESSLAKESQHILDTTVEKEACPHNLAPTTSTAAQLAMGDALAMALMEARGFTARDFATYHPGGSLGKKLYTTVGSLVERGPHVSLSTPMEEVLVEISKGRLGATAVLDNGQVVGIVTDGDLRRLLEKGEKLNEATAESMMSPNPKTMDGERLAVAAFELMESNSITQIVITGDGQYRGIVHLHDILKEGIF